MKTYDIAIVGGGISGCALACALAPTGLSIIVLEASDTLPKKTSSTYSERISSISLSSQKLFERLGVWKTIPHERISPFKQIKVWEANHSHEIIFDSSEIAEKVLGFIVENNAMHNALYEKLKTYPHIEYVNSIKLTDFSENNFRVNLSTENQSFSAKLAVACDGANSWLSEKANIEITKFDYEQKAIVTNVQTEKPHQQIARQCFTKKGPLAFLPLSKTNLSSIVWSQPVSDAQRIMELDDEHFKEELTDAFENQLGKVLSIEKRFSFPLFMQEAKQYLKSQVVLVGDAAHSIHPLAGQGLNMGLLDVVCLAETIKNILAKKRDFSLISNLRSYERARKADHFPLMSFVHQLNALFLNEKKSVQTLRKIGMSTTNHFSSLKNIFTRHAVGNR